jgi:hypothetical protein
VSLKSFATEADPQTQTYEVVLGLTRRQDVRILPGMSAEVLPDTAAARRRRGRRADDGQAPAHPIAAVVAAADGTPRSGWWTRRRTESAADPSRPAPSKARTSAERVTPGERHHRDRRLHSGERIASTLADAATCAKASGD